MTGAAGFIGFHLTLALLERGDEVVGVDNLNDYYDPQLKQDRLDVIGAHALANAFTFLKEDIADREAMSALFKRYSFDVVVNLAAQAGVRYSLENPNAYVDSNLVGFVNILEGCRHSKVSHLVYASSSSVYGMNAKQPFSVEDRVDHPISLYAATKKSNELMAHTYSHLFNIPTTGLRFFTVYGPYGRPDMAYFKFTQSIINGEAIDVYAENRMERDFTYIDDIISGILPLLNSEFSEQAGYCDTDKKLYRIFNIGGGRPISLSGFIRAIEKSCGKKALKNHLPMQPGDVISTFADISNLAELSDYNPAFSVEEGVQRFYDWYKNYSEISNDWAE